MESVLATPLAAFSSRRSRLACLSVLLLLLSGVVPARAQSPVPNIGDMAVYNNAGAASVILNHEGGATPTVRNTFTNTVIAPLTSYVLEPAGDGVKLSAGKHLVLYNVRADHNAGGNRAELVTHLTLENGAATNELAYGRAQGFIRQPSGADEAVISGGTIVNANANDILRLHTTRTDVNSAKTIKIVPGHTAIQLLKLDDSLDYLRLRRAANTAAANSTAFVDVTYDTVDEASGGAMSFTPTTGNIVLKTAGHYLVLANTHLKRTTSDGVRFGFTQRLRLNTTTVAGSLTTSYLRGSQNAEQADDGTLTIGMIIAASAGDTLSVEHMREAGNTAVNIIGDKTALTIVELPSTASLIRLQDTTGQDLNTGSATPVTFNTQNGTPAAVFTHSTSVNPSRVSVNDDSRFLFLGAFFCDEDTTDRQVPNQRWSVNSLALAYGQSSQYSRNANVNNNGNWSGFLAGLADGDVVEMTSQQLGAGGGLPGHSMGLQGADILYLSTSPVLWVNERLDVTATTTGTITPPTTCSRGTPTPRPRG